jgi:hypothetical protein
VEGINADLNHEEHEEDCGDLKEPTHINQMREACPRQSHRDGCEKSERRSPNQTRATNLQKHQRRFHPFAADHQDGEKKNSRESHPSRSHGNLAQAMLHSLFQARARPPHVNDERHHHQDRDKSEYSFPHSFVREKARNCGPEPLFD